MRGPTGRPLSIALSAALLLAACSDDGTDSAPGEAGLAISTTTAAPPPTSGPTTSTTSAEPPPTTADPTTTVPSAVALTAADIASATIVIDGTPVVLAEGAADAPFEVRVIGSVVGDLTGDGIDDAAAVVTHQEPGTTGRWSSLLAFHDPGDGVRATLPVTYVDRGRTHDLRIDDGAIRLRWSEQQFADGRQLDDRYTLDAVTTELVAGETTTADLVVGGDGGLVFDTSTVLAWGASPAETRAALAPLLGEPDETNTTPTCWGSQVGYLWSSDDTRLVWVTFLEGEWYRWGATDPRFGAATIAVPGASMAWLEQWEGTPFDMYTAEIGGGWYSTHYGGAVSFDEDTGDVLEVGGRWESDFFRLHTIIDDDPALWCGD